MDTSSGLICTCLFAQIPLYPSSVVLAPISDLFALCTLCSHMQMRYGSETWSTLRGTPIIMIAMVDTQIERLAGHKDKNRWLSTVVTYEQKSKMMDRECRQRFGVKKFRMKCEFY